LAIAELLFSEGHPAADGHFPGNPIIPGAVLLAEALRAIEASASIVCYPVIVKSAKFFGPTRPGDRVRIEYSHSTDQGIRFRCVVKETAVLAGELRCNVAPTA
jgi:3-hydroxymyristoyl/3-hydroxydecanoyl-(acyl carrier protein) dehydratase